MATFINTGLVSLEKRLSEVTLILNEAKNNFEINDDLYNALCRSAQVIISAHFEGYLKELLRNALEDINSFSSYKKSNKFLKQKVSEHFIINNAEERNSKAKYLKVQELIEVLENLDTKFQKEYFYGSENKNPKATILDKIVEQFGVKDFFKTLKKSNLDLIFSNTHPENIEKKNEIKDYLRISTENFPYSISLEFLEIAPERIDADNLWDAFLGGMLKRRHDIAHGTEIENSVGHSIIESDIVKIEILCYAITTFICLNSNPIEIVEEI